MWGCCGFSFCCVTGVLLLNVLVLCDFYGWDCIAFGFGVRFGLYWCLLRITRVLRVRAYVDLFKVVLWVSFCIPCEGRVN